MQDRTGLIIKVNNKIMFDKNSKNISLNFDNKNQYRKDSNISIYEYDEINKKKIKKDNNISKVVCIYDSITVFELAQKLSIKSSNIVNIMMDMGVNVSINQNLDKDTACLVIEKLGHIPKLITNKDEGILNKDNNSKILKNRPPIVTIVGHVDHGKTTLLDCIRKTNVVDKEYGGITQHISSYMIKTSYGNITFLDTPGHAFFSQMRNRGVICTDIVLLIIAANDGIMPQTIESINYIKKYKVPLIVVITKIDKTTQNTQKIINDLLNYEIVSESLGGDVIVVEISAKENIGISNLLESIMLQAEMLDLKANFDCLANGIVIESRIDKKIGILTIVLIKDGILKVGDIILSGIEYGRIRNIFSDSGASIKQAGPSMPVEIIGLSGCSLSGDDFIILNDEKKAKNIVSYRKEKYKDKKNKDINNIFEQENVLFFSDQNKKVLNIIFKADAYGSLEALNDVISNIKDDKVIVKVIHCDVGDFNESDINLALYSKALVIGFNVKISSIVKKIIVRENIKVKIFNIVYEILDYILDIINKMNYIKIEECIGTAKIKDLFNISNNKIIFGCFVLDGLLKKTSNVKIFRDDVLLYTGKIDSLRRFKDMVDEVSSGMECGISIKSNVNIKINDIIKAY